MTASPPYRHAPVALCGVGLSLQTRGAPISVSLATVYKTLHQFTEAGLLRDAVEPGRSYFDPNTAGHHHFLCEATGKLQDIPAGQRAAAAAGRH